MTNELEVAHAKYAEEKAAVAAGETEIEYGEKNDLGLMTEKGSRRQSRMSFEARCQRYLEMTFDGGYFDPDLCERQPFPPESQTAMDDELGIDFINRLGLKVVFHFWFKRWVVIQEATDGKGFRGWRVVYLCCGPKRPGYIPPDLDDDAHFDVLVGAIGDYKVPDRRDFRMLKEMIDPAVRGTAEEYARREVKKSLDKSARQRRDMDNYGEQWMDEYGMKVQREANQKRGSMQGYHKIPQKSHEEVRREREASFETVDVLNPKIGEKMYSIKKYKVDVPHESIADMQDRLIGKAAARGDDLALSARMESQKDADVVEELLKVKVISAPMTIELEVEDGQHKSR